MDHTNLTLDSRAVNGQRLRQARELRGLTQTALADLMSIDQTMVAHIERGMKQPSTEVLEHLAAELELPESFFHQSEPPEFPRGSLLFRSKSGVGKRIIAQAHAHAAIVFEMALRLSARASLIPVRLPIGNSPVITAQNVRQSMAAPEGPLHGLIRAIERLGVLVFPLPDIQDCDAFSVWAGPARSYPVIALVKSKAADRLRLTVAHELGHLVLHRYSTSGTHDLEVEAYMFATELLMPRSSILPDLVAERLTLFRLAALKAKWGVSMQALARRARDLEVITDRQYRYLMKQFSLNGWRTEEPNLTPVRPELPRALRKLAEVALGTPIRLKQAAKELVLPENFVSQLFEQCEPPPSKGQSLPRRQSKVLQFRSGR